jgi:hypothetical protein
MGVPERLRGGGRLGLEGLLPGADPLRGGLSGGIENVRRSIFGAR